MRGGGPGVWRYPRRRLDALVDQLRSPAPSDGVASSSEGCSSPWPPLRSPTRLGFTEVVESYQPGGRGTAMALAFGLVAGELAAAFALWSSDDAPRRAGAWLALAVSLTWTAMAVQAFSRGLVLDNCGCFGVHLAQPLRWWVLVEGVISEGSQRCSPGRCGSCRRPVPGSCRLPRRGSLSRSRQHAEPRPTCGLPAPLAQRVVDG